jgi:putative Mg2+ transporter-C (MgtC) family protein
LDPLRDHDFFEMFLRLSAATLLGGTLGIDRDLHRKPAGMRVLALVSMGGAAIAMASVIMIPGDEHHPGDGVLRTVQGVLSGIGFLGAGVILRTQGRDEIHGMTTATSIWVSSIFGMICGLGQWKLALCTFALAWLVLTCGRWVEGQVLRFAPPPDPQDPNSKQP